MLQEAFLYSKDLNVKPNRHYMVQNQVFRDNSTAENSDDFSDQDDIEPQTEQYSKSQFAQYNMQVPLETEDEQQVEIDVKPKKKHFQSQDEKVQFINSYTIKLKTELCKNWQVSGKCKFGEKCCFAHGTEQLKEKVHLHSNYRTKPCKKFFQNGYCNYGNRCQYQHNSTQVFLNKQFKHFITKLYQDKGIKVPTQEMLTNMGKRSQKIHEAVKKLPYVKENHLFGFRHQRLQIFKDLSEKTKQCPVEQPQTDYEFNDEIEATMSLHSQSSQKQKKNSRSSVLSTLDSDVSSQNLYDNCTLYANINILNQPNYSFSYNEVKNSPFSFREKNIAL